MLNSVVFAVLLLASCLYALRRGGAPERIGAVVYLLAAFGTLAVVSNPAGRYAAVEVGIVVIDLLMLAALFTLALRAERFWPIWATGIHIIAAAGHAIKLAEPELMRWAYAFVLAFWSYPMLLILVIGTRGHQARLKRAGVDPSWSRFSGPSEGMQTNSPSG